MAHKIQIKRGNKADLPTLDVGEFGLCQDTNELFIGNNGNQKIFPPTAPTISDVEGLQTALDNKVDNSRVLTNVPVNAKFTDTTYSEISTSEIDAGTSSTLRTITGRRIKYILDKVQGWINALTKADVGLGNVDNIKQASKTEFDAHLAEDASQYNVHGLRGTALCLGSGSSISGIYPIALGRLAEALGNYSIATGHDANVSGTSSIAIGRNAKVNDRDSIAIGYNSLVESYESIALGNNAKTTSRNGVSIGSDSQVIGYDGIAIGRNSSALKSNTIVFGNGAESDGIHAVVIGTSAESTANTTAAIGRGAKVENAYEGVLGTDVQFGLTKWIVPGDFTVNGTKNFEMPHPKPEKKATHRIRHGAVESPTPGDTLYRYKIQATKDNDLVTIDLPDYFVWLNKDVQIFVTPQGHFGNGYGILNREAEQLEIHCQFAGEYNVLVIGTRNDDHQSVQDWNIKGVEREIGESWTGETYAFSVDEIMEVEEIKEVS